MPNIIPFDTPSGQSAIAAFAKKFGGKNNDLVGNSASQGFPVISIKGKVFHIQRGDERTLITKPGEDDPAGSIEVVIIRANPNRSKVYYADGYQEGTTAKPDCYSNDGVAPAADAKSPQSKKCATCVHNQWGARITSDGRKAKNCADSRRLAISTVETPADPMMMRVPAASMKALEEYGKMLAARGVPPQTVVTKIGFDYTVAHPALTFKAVGLIGDAETLRAIDSMHGSELVANIVGIAPAATTEAEANEDTPLPVIQPPPPTPAPAPAPAPAPVAASKPATVPKVKADPVDAAVAAAATTKKAVVQAEAESLDQSIASMLDGLNFDDN